MINISKVEHSFLLTVLQFSDLQANSEEEHGEDEEDEDEEDEDEDGNEWVTDEGEESDVEDNVELAFPKQRRESNPELPDTVTVLDALHGSKVYLVGTAHFSIESQDDVSKVRF